MPTVIPVELPTSPVGGAPRTPWEAPTGAATPTSRSQAEALFQQDIEDAAVPYSERVSAALADTDTAYIAEGVLGIFDQVEPEDPDFDPLPHIQAVREAYSLPSDDDTLAELGSARSMAELSRAGEAIRGRLDRAKLLDGHWGLALTAGVLDPVGVLADAATFGGARALKLGRLASAVAGASGTTAVTAAADASGREATLLDYTLGAAVNAGVFAMVGGKGLDAPAFDRLGKPSFGGSLTDFLSETDKIAGANPLTRELNSRLVDDPVRRDGLLRNENAASYLRVYSNQADHLLHGWEQTLDKEIAKVGVGYMSRKFDLTGKAAQARADIEDAVAAELLRRDSEYIRFGAVSPASDARIGALADQYEAMMRHGAETAKAARLPGFKDFEGRPGYFHRAWNENKMYEVEQAHGREFLRNILVASARSGMGLDETDAGTIATAIITRMDAKRRGLRADFMGALGKADSEGIAAILIDAGVDEAVRKSIMRKIDQNLSDRGKIKYGKERLPLDMTISARAADGRVVRMQDLIDTDLTRLAENYMQSMSGRSALARVGLGGDDASLSEYKELQRLALEGDEGKFRVKWDEFQANVRRRFEGAPEQATAPRQTPEPTPEPTPAPAAPAAPEPVAPAAPAAQAPQLPTPTPGAPKLPKELAGATPNYNLGGKPFKLRFKSDVAKALYIVTGKGKSAKHDQYVNWLKSLGYDDAAIADMGAKVRQRIRMDAEGAEPGELNITLTPPRPATAPAATPTAAPATRGETDYPQDPWRPEGWREPIEDVVRTLSQVENTADALRVVKQMGNVEPALGRIIDRLLRASDLDKVPFKIVEGASAKAEGFGATTRGQMSITVGGERSVSIRGAVSPSERRLGGSTGVHPWTIVHEALHAAVRKSITLTEKGRGSAKELKLHRDLSALRMRVIAKATAARNDSALQAKMRAELPPEDFRAWMRGVDLVAGRSNIGASVDELVTWGLTDTNVQMFMRHTGGVGKAESAMSRFVAAIREFLGLGAGDTSSLRELVEYSDELLSTAAKRADQSPEDFYKEYKGTGGAVQEATRQRLTPDDIDDRMKQLDYLLGDFTGIRPPEGVLGTNAQRVKSLAQATMLSASGLWQVAETATMAWRYGAARAGAEMFKQFPGVAGLLRKVGRDPDLYDELATVLHVDFARDVRIRPWLRQYEANYLLKGDSGLDRALHYGQQAVPIINAMKFVHKWQTRVNANLAMNTLARAAHGDASALRMLQEYGLKGADWEQVQAAIKANVTMRGKNAESMNWAAWDKATLDKAMLAATRMMDDAVLYGRAGQGSSFSRSSVGQILGQFRSFVSFAHNKLLRGTIQNSGYTGLAALLAHQYPLTVLMVATNEFRKGEDVSFDEDGILDLMQKAVGYTAALGFIGDAAGIAGLSGGRGGYSVPITGLANAVPAAVGIPGELLAGDPTAAAGNAVQVARTALPFVSIMPGIAALQNALED